MLLFALALALAPASDKVEDEAELPPVFLKGELTHFGTTQLLHHENAAGLSVGLSQIDTRFYLAVQPRLSLEFGEFAVGLGVPLRFEIGDTAGAAQGTAFANVGAFRTEDWDEVGDFLRPLRYVTWGKKEDNLYIDLNRVHHLTIGHGQLMRRYSPTVDIDEDNLFAEVDAYGDFGGVELIAGPFPLPRLLGGLAFIKPLGFTGNTVARSLSIGASYVVDINAPARATSIVNIVGRRQIAVLDNNELHYETTGAITGPKVQGVGVDAEIKVYKDDSVDVKLYADHSMLIFEANDAAGLSAFSDSGTTLGALFRLNYGQRGAGPAHALRIRVEGRAFGARYLPSYFDTLYEVEKFQLGFSDTPLQKRAELPSKWAYLHEQEGGLRVGAYVEASYLWSGILAGSIALEDAISTTGEPSPGSRNFALHLETDGLAWLQLFATYHVRHLDDLSQVLRFTSDNELLYLGGRLRVLPFLFLHLASQRSFRLGFGPDDNAKERAPLPGGGTDKFRYTSAGLQNTWATTAAVEFGWVF